MSDETIFGSEYGKEDSGICPKCGEWNCKDHADVNDAFRQDTGFGGGPGAFMGAVLMIPLSDKVKEMLKRGEGIVINTGKANTFEKVEADKDEEQDEQEAEEQDEQEEQEEEDEDEDREVSEDEKKAIDDMEAIASPEVVDTTGGKKVPKFGKVNLPPIHISGRHTRYDDEEREIAPNSKGEAMHLDLVKEEMVMTSRKGLMMSWRQYRAKKTPMAPMYAERFLAVQKKAEEIIPNLRRQISAALEAEAKIAQERGTKKGKIDAGLVHKVATEASVNIFSRKAAKKSFKSAVSIVLDDSGSMAETPAGIRATASILSMGVEEFLACKAGAVSVLTYALGEVFNSLGVKFEIVSYQMNFRCPSERNWGSFHWDGHYAIQYKGFNEAWNAVKGRLVNYIPLGAFLPYEAANYAMDHLLKQDAQKRVCIMLTDADDSNKGSGELGYLSTEVDRRYNIQFVGIGILQDNIKSQMPGKSEVVMKLEDLNSAVFNKLAKLIHPAS